MEKYNFQKAVEGTPDIATAYRSGLKALKRNERSSVSASDTWILDGSASGIYIRGINDSEQTEVAENWLKEKAPLLDAIPKAAPAFV